jgi:hypothetical protein
LGKLPAIVADINALLLAVPELDSRQHRLVFFREV